MLRTVEAVIGERGDVRLLQTVRLRGSRRALVTFLDQEPNEAAHKDITPGGTGETALLSEAALAEDWLQKEEDEAWAHLQGGQHGDARGAARGQGRSRRVR